MEAKAVIGWDPSAFAVIASRIQMALQTGHVSLGDSTKLVEGLWPGEGGDRHSVVVSNGTTALELVWHLFRPRVVIAPEMTVPMVHWSAKNSPSRPTLIKVDVDDTLCADITKIDEAIELAKLNGSDLSDVAVCYVMTAGLVSPGLAAAAVRWRSLGVKVVLDMSHAHGATYNGYAPYTWADAATWSFYATKVLTSGEGGIAWFSDPQHAEDAKIVANQGKKRGTGKFMVEGRGYRLSEFAAAVMAYEVTMARTVYQKRQSVAKSYEGFGIPGLHQFVPQLQTSFYKYVVPVSATKFAPDSADAVEEAFASLGVRCTGRVHGFSENGGRPWSMPRAKFWAQNHVCLPVGRLMHPMMLETIEEAWKQIRK